MNQKKDDEAEAWGFEINDFDGMKYAKGISKSRGMIGINKDLHPQKTIILFRNENDAKVCRNILEYANCRVGHGVAKIFVPINYVRGNHVD